MLSSIKTLPARYHAAAHLQRGMTLMEMIASLSVMAVVIVGALALFGSATTSESSVTMQTNIGALQSAARQLFYGQGTYGAAGTDLNAVLVTAKKIPSTITIGGTAAAPTFTYRSTTLDVQSTGTSFKLVLGNVEPALCVALLTSAAGWTSIDDPAGTSHTAFPISPSDANTGCAATGAITLTN